MSWEAAIFNCEENTPAYNELSMDWVPLELGYSLEKLQSVIESHFPGVDWENDKPYRGHFMSNRYGITFVLDEHEPQKSILLTSRGGNPIPDLLKLIAKEPGWRLLDGTIGKWIDPNSGSTPGFEAAQKYTEQIKKSDVDKNVDDEE